MSGGLDGQGMRSASDNPTIWEIFDKTVKSLSNESKSYLVGKVFQNSQKNDWVQPSINLTWPKIPIKAANHE